MHLNADWAGESVQWLQSRKIRTRPLFDKLEIDRRDLKFGRQISVQHFAAILDYGALKTNDLHFGLHRGSDFNVKNGGILAYLAASAGSVGDAIQSYRRYAAIVCDGFSLELEYDRAGVELLLHVSDPIWKECRHLGEFAAARTISGLRKIAGIHLCPLSVRFMYPNTASSSECRRVFRCTVEYGARADVIKLSSDAMRIQIPTADSRLGYMLRSYADGLLRQALANDENSLQDKVANIIAQRLPSRNASLRSVAHQLKLSERTLRRRLQQDNLRFGELVSRVRLKLANDWLARTDFDLKHISFLLGYSEPAAFSRAYKRWTGQSPGRTRVG